MHKEFTDVVLRLKYPITSISPKKEVLSPANSVKNEHMFSHRMLVPSKELSEGLSKEWVW